MCLAAVAKGGVELGKCESPDCKWVVNSELSA
jgi:hypothetical protein